MIIKKKGLKCGLLLALFIIFGLSLSVCLEDTNALKYDLEYIPFTVPQIAGNNGHQLNRQFRFDGSTNGSSNFLKFGNYYFNSDLDSSNRCSYSSYNSVRTNYDRYYIPYYLQPEDYGYSLSDVPDYFPCWTDGALPSDFVQSSLPSYTFGTPDLRSYLPYRYYYNGAFLYSSYKENGFNIDSKFEFSEIFENDELPDDVSTLQIPIGVSSVELHQDDVLTFEGSFYLDSRDVDNVLTLNSHTGYIYAVALDNYLSYVTPNTTSNAASQTPCQLTLSQNDNANEFPYILSYSCSVTILRDSSLSGFTLYFSHDSSHDFIWSYPDAYSMIYDSSIVVTNGDYTPAPDNVSFQDFELHTNNLHDVPGYAGDTAEDIIQNNINYSQSLITLFGFSFINPFSPIFDLFTNNSSCAQIPTIAGMIHSEETQVCPWFDSTTRNIVTPVLGLSSMMLVFGFAVRWLGSSSGNMMEDDFSGDSGGFNVGTRGRSKN